MKLFFCLLYLTIVFKVDAIRLQSRYGAKCAYLMNKVYCFGGSGNTDIVNDTIVMLDINKSTPTSSSSLIDQWEIINATRNGAAFGKREFSQALPLPDGKSFLVHGGYDQNSTSLDQTIIYNVETNTWTAKANYSEPENGGLRQIYYGTGVYIDSLNSIGFYGGLQQHVENGTNFIRPDGTSISGLTFVNQKNESVSAAGFYHLTLYDLTKNTWSRPEQTNVPFAYSNTQSATYIPSSKKIYYFGGMFFDTTDFRLHYYDMNCIFTYDTVSSAWKNVCSNSSEYPTSRNLHSTTLLSDEYTILLYGGSDDTFIPVADYCYTLNTQTNQWRRHYLLEPTGASAQRAYHSAVLIDNSTLGIFFGVDRTGYATNELLFLNVGDIDHLSFADTYPIINNISQPINTKPNNNTAIAIGVGVACGVSAILVAAIFYFLRKRKQKSQTSAIQESNNTHPQTEMLEVDWDKIDGQFHHQASLPHQLSPPSHHSPITTQVPNEAYSPGLSEPSTIHVGSSGNMPIKPDVGH